MASQVKCNICGSSAPLLFKGEVLGKHKIEYYQCSSCQFIQTETPYWLEEAYADAIGSTDIGLIQRNNYLSERAIPVIQKHFNSKSKFLDYGGGYGMFVRIMRDNGFDFYRQDQYCENLFAKNFDISDLADDKKFELITAFEVFEHLMNPVADISKLFEMSDSILFSTELQGDVTYQSQADWWYFSPEAGQHISLFSLKSLQYLSEKFNKNLYSNENIHLLTDKKLSSSVLSVPIHKKVLRKLLKGNRSSLLQKDFENIKDSKKS